MAGPTVATIKRLFSLSGNTCAYPRCTQPLVDNGVFVGEMCHIEGERPDAPRYNPVQTDDERRAFENIILLCPTHHTVIDKDETAHTVERLKKIKQHHESRQNAPFSITTNLAVVLSLFTAGSIVGAVSDRLAGALKAPDATVVGRKGGKRRALHSQSTHPLPKLRALCKSFGAGKIVFHADLEPLLDLGKLMARIAIADGWQAAELDNVTLSQLQASVPGEATLTILISHQDERAHELAILVIDMVLRKFGFVALQRGSWHKDAHSPDSILVTVGRF